MTNLDKAREWADRHRNVSDHRLTAGFKAAAEVIQSLPDQWVDVEKVYEIIKKMNEYLETGCSNDFGQGYNYATRHWREALESLLTPKLPTLADMTEEEREACKWMQCEIDGQLAGILARVDEQRGHIWVDSGHSLGWKLENITPLPDLPKLEWPGSIAQEPTGASLDPQENIDASLEYRRKIISDQQPNSSETPKSSINPEDVPPNEPWLVEANGEKAIGTRYKGDAHTPWSVASLDGSFAGDYNDKEITLIHKLVPETPALPEGMRLADHETLGRIVVSQRADEDGDYAFFESISGGIAGASWGYVNESELTFLDGEA